MKERKLWRARFGAALFVVLLLPELGTSSSPNIPVKDMESELFLGEHVRLSNAEGPIERQMIGLSDEDYFTLTQRYELSTRWETKDGTPIGDGKALQRLTPAESKTYRLRISVRLKPGEVHSLAPPVAQVALPEYEALYRVRLRSGTITVRADPGEKELVEGAHVRFFARKDSGELFSCTAAPESDPETGKTFLAGKFSGLPYGVFTVFPEQSAEGFFAETSRICFLGVWEYDDTVSVHRAGAQAKFTFL